MYQSYINQREEIICNYRLKEKKDIFLGIAWFHKVWNEFGYDIRVIRGVEDYTGVQVRDDGKQQARVEE